MTWETQKPTPETEKLVHTNRDVYFDTLLQKRNNKEFKKGFSKKQKEKLSIVSSLVEI